MHGRPWQMDPPREASSGCHGGLDQATLQSNSASWGTTRRRRSAPCTPHDPAMYPRFGLGEGDESGDEWLGPSCFFIRQKGSEMSVATHLGLTDSAGELALARQRWSSWQSSREVLNVVDNLDDLPGWLRAADAPTADGVMLALAELSAPDGGDDVVATAALLWLLLPGARLLAYRLGRFCQRIDEMVAAQLWVEARTFPWRRGQKVAANILMNTRKGVMRDLGIGSQADPTWACSVLVEPAAGLWLDALSAVHDEDPFASTPEQELHDLLAVAVASGALSLADVDLLLSLAVAADQADPSRSKRGHGGLMSPAASDAIAITRGVTGRTVRRHAARSVQELRCVVRAAHERVSA